MSVIVIYRIVLYFYNDIKMKNYKIKAIFVSPEELKALAIKASFNSMIWFYYSWKVVYNRIRYMFFFQYSLEPVVIQQISIGFKAILEIILLYKIYLHWVREHRPKNSKIIIRAFFID